MTLWKDDIMGLYEDELHTVLKGSVTEQTIQDLRKSSADKRTRQVESIIRIKTVWKKELDNAEGHSEQSVE